MRRHIMHTNYDSIKTILAFEGLRRPSDINTLKLDEEGYIASTTYPWVKQIYEHLEDSSVAAQTALAVWGSDPGQYFQINGMNCINKYHLSKFSCFFPGRTIVSAGDIKRREDCYCIQASSLFNFFFSDIISENDLGFYTPNSINGNTLKSIISLQQDRFRIADLDKVELTRDLVNRINDLKVEMQIKLEMKKAELRRKGIITSVGMCLAGIPYLISAKFQEVDPTLLSQLIGGVGIFECVNLISDGLAKSRLPQNHPLWVIWKWSEKTQKREKSSHKTGSSSETQ